jgi:competence ComEA-like helix-hairpin-helix protein
MIRFTKEEKVVIMFLLASLFVGITVARLRKTSPAFRGIFEFDEKRVEGFKKVNINRADREELVRLKRVGPVLAGRIIAYREKYGPFETKEDIKNVKGIGDKTYEKMKEEILLE